MKCPNCNAELQGQPNFCYKCGSQLPHYPEQQTETCLEQQTEQQTETYPDEAAQQTSGYIQASPPKNKSNKFLIGGAVLLLVIAVIGGGLYWRHITKIKEFERLQAQRQEQLAALTDGAGNLWIWVETEKKDFGRFVMTQEEEEQLEALWKDGRKLDPEDYEGQLQFVQSVQDLKNAVENRSREEAGAMLEEMKKMDPGYASESQLTRLAAYASDMEQMISDGQYQGLEALAQEWKSFAEEASVKKTGFDVSVMQYDLTEYPTVRLYVDVRESATGASVKELAPSMFYIAGREAGTGDFYNRVVDKAILMNENERLNINLLADTSGSMAGPNMDAAKTIIYNFLNTVQFSAGDQVKLTQFNSIIDKTGFFTNNIEVLHDTVRNYIPEGQTKLYDSIVYGVQDISGQEGAKCVIAFTDGMDAGSYHSAQDVIDVVSGYHIPVFIVRIGGSSASAEDYSLQMIAQASGGSFKNLSQFSQDMSAFYNQIYRQLKEYYVVEYTEDKTAGITQDQEFSVYVQNQSMGGETVMTVNPGNELFDSLLGSYLRSYIVDMNNHYYDQLRQYVDGTLDPEDHWSIQWQMQKQVTGGFSNVTAETLMEYAVTDITVEDENTVRIKTREVYDVIYDEIYGEIQTSNSDIYQDALNYLGNYYYPEDFSDDTQLRIWAVVTQFPEYILRKGADGKWKFSQYAGDLSLGLTKQFYYAEMYP